MSEERHSLSDPRFVVGGRLEWEVDVYRKGVEDPVDTLRIDDETLPPRANRKGKIVWRLPQEPDKLPSFGTEDRRRILELFKERKKNRRKATKKSPQKTADKSADNDTTPTTERRESDFHGHAAPNQSLLATPASLPPGFQPTQLNSTHFTSTSSSSTTTTLPPPSSPPPPSLEHVPPPTSRHILIPMRDRTTDLNSNEGEERHGSLAVGAAKAFVDLYYPHVTHGLSADLAMHYTPLAQKSISVGGAHAVVATNPDITRQLASLSGTVFVVRGVVAQDAHDGMGAHILVTGTIQTTPLSLLPHHLKQEEEHLTPLLFAHSISLVPSSQNNIHSSSSLDVNGYERDGEQTMRPFAFQIHNDALSLLSVVEPNIQSITTPLVHSPQTNDSMEEDGSVPKSTTPKHAILPPPGLFG